MFKDIFSPPPTTTLFKVYAFYGGEFPDRMAIFSSYDKALEFTRGAEHYEIFQIK